ncbi:MAG: hypothetical protein ABFS56_14365 [Pseudomonadota bacterium]
MTILNILTAISLLGNSCQIPTLDENLNLTTACVKHDNQHFSFRLQHEKIGNRAYWKSTGFENIDCQPAPTVCASLDNHLNLKIPFQSNGRKYIAHLSPDFKKYYWKYRYHYEVIDLGLKNKALTNEAAYIPSQCYTKTLDAHNPCFTCHQDSTPPNYNNDADLQTSYAFPDYALSNHWTNLFKDRTQQVNAIKLSPQKKTCQVSKTWQVVVS